MTKHHRNLGLMVAGIASLFMVADFLLRFAPTEWFAFRPWEAAQRYNVSTGPFAANKRLVSFPTHGDLAALGNVRDVRLVREEDFTTDSRGFRNLPYAGTYDAILLGDSFSAGAALSDRETLSYRLGELGFATYNAASWALVSAKQIAAVARAAGMARGTVIYQYLDRNPIPTEGVVFSGLDAFLRTLPPDWAHGADLLRDHFALSPMSVVVGRAMKSLQNDRFLPNAYRNRVVRGTLANGSDMLFLKEEVASVKLVRRIGVDYWTRLQTSLALEGFELVVLLLPSKFAVYRELCLDPELRTPPLQPYLSELEQAIRKEGIPVINPESDLRAEARKLLEQGKYLYWPDDTHWRAEGPLLVAKAVAGILGRSATRT